MDYDDWINMEGKTLKVFLKPKLLSNKIIIGKAEVVNFAGNQDKKKVKEFRMGLNLKFDKRLRLNMKEVHIR